MSAYLDMIQARAAGLVGFRQDTIKCRLGDRQEAEQLLGGDGLRAVWRPSLGQQKSVLGGDRGSLC